MSCISLFARFFKYVLFFILFLKTVSITVGIYKSPFCQQYQCLSTLHSLVEMGKQTFTVASKLSLC